MFNAGNKLRCIRGIRNQLTVGNEYVVADDNVRGANYVRIAVTDQGIEDAVYLADRFELIVEAPAAPAIIHPRHNGPFIEGDVIVCHRVCDDLTEGKEYVVLPRLEFRDNMVRVVDDGGFAGAYFTNRFHLVRPAPEPVVPIAPPVPAAPAHKVGPIAYEDVVPGMEVVYVGGGEQTHNLREFRKDAIYILEKQYLGVERACWVIGDDGVSRGVFRDNFHHAPPKAPLEIVVGGYVRCIKEFQGPAGVLVKDEVYKVLAVTDKNIKLEAPLAWYGRNRFVACEAPAEEAPNPILPFDQVKIGHYAKIISEVGIPDDLDECVNDGKFYKISYVDHDDETIYIKGSFIPASSCEIYAREGKYVAPKVAPKPPITLRQAFKNKTAGKYHGWLSSFAYKSKGGANQITLSAACYAGLRHARNIEELYIGFIPMVEQVKQQGAGALDNFKLYADYIMNESPWAACFITKTYEQALDEALEMDVTKSLSQVVSAAVALRMGHEYYSRVPVFLELIEKGYSKDVAFLVSMVAGKNKDKWSQISTGDNHAALHSKSQVDKLLTFFAKGYQGLGKDQPCTSNNQGYSLFASIDPSGGQYGYDYNYDGSFDELATDTFVTYEDGAGWGKTEYVTEESVLEFANVVTNKLKEYK